MGRHLATHEKIIKPPALDAQHEVVQTTKVVSLLI